MYFIPLQNRKIAQKSKPMQVAPAKTSPRGDRSSLGEVSYDPAPLNPASVCAQPSPDLATQLARLNGLLVDKQNLGSLRVMILGIRGFPNVQGGAEKHAEKLAWRSRNSAATSRPSFALTTFPGASSNGTKLKSCGFGIRGRRASRLSFTHFVACCMPDGSARISSISTASDPQSLRLSPVRWACASSSLTTV